MTSLPDDLIRDEIAQLPDYNAGLALDRFRELYGRDAVAKLDSNENPYGPSPQAIAVMREGAAGVARYPDAGDTALRMAIGAASGTPADRVIIGNGSEDLIGAIYRAVLRPGDRVVTICPSFGLHEFAAQGCGATVEKVHFGADWAFPLEGLIAALARPARVLMFSSPSNPAGPAITRAQLEQLLGAVPAATLVVFDEAYREYLSGAFAFDALAVLAASGRAWISLRTFSKAYGLAGARVGYGLCSHPAMALALRKTRNPFAVNALAGTAAIAALADDAHLARGVALTLSERDRVSAALADLGLAVAPAQGNFLFFQTPNGTTGQAFAEALRHHGILIKGWQEEGWRDWARVTIALPAENDAFLEALRQVLAA
ncbi:MAG: aminotransferase class I/II-fold pyridoxal phosphate-dependent enzyme [Paracoccus sp. (in: a-proteobacteria)]|nr:aminotransferase class I/II-fold pyridoxal phosphate-dependent enzyme [Paracoccus sp. (in: a-proteobacteria)]